MLTVDPGKGNDFRAGVGEHSLKLPCFNSGVGREPNPRSASCIDAVSSHQTVFIYRSFTIGPRHFLRVREGVVAAWRNCIRRVAEGLWNNRKERPAFLFVLGVLGIAFRG